ncbi:fkbM_fam, methyltransferase, FkbM family [Caulobacteraceae bacterium]
MMHLTFRQRCDWLAHVLKAAFQQHHTELRPVFRPYIPDDAVVLDVGAHAGQFARLFAGMAPRGRVWSFEPSEYARSVMNLSSAIRRIPNIELVPFGLSDAPGELVLHTPVKKAGGLGFGAAHLGADGGSRQTVEQTVLLTTLDAFVADKGLSRVDFIKADIEGWEMHALRGAERTLERFRPVLFLEVSDAHLTRAGESAVALFRWLEARGYRAHSVPDGRPVPDYVEAGDYLFIHA